MTAKWEKFAAKLKQMRTKTECNDTKIEEIVVQRMSSEVSGKHQKYCRIGAREYFPFEHEELTIDNITDACQKHFRALIGEEMACVSIAFGSTCTSLYLSLLPSYE